MSVSTDKYTLENKSFNNIETKNKELVTSSINFLGKSVSSLSDKIDSSAFLTEQKITTIFDRSKVEENQQGKQKLTCFPVVSSRVSAVLFNKTIQNQLSKADNPPVANPPSSSLLSQKLATQVDKKRLEHQFITKYAHSSLLSRQQAENLLEKYPINTGILRFSTKMQDYVLSMKVKTGFGFEHNPLGKNSLSAILKYTKISQLIVPGETEPLSLIKLEKQMLKEGNKTHKSERKYDHQIILNLGRGKTAEGLTAKVKNQKLSSTTIDLKGMDHSFKALKELTHASRLYIIGHCQKGSNTIFSDQGQYVRVEDYVQMLLTYAPHLKEVPKGQKLKISVVACESGLDDGISKSFGYRLSQALDKAGISAEVFARTDRTNRAKSNPESYRKLVAGKHQAEGSKVVFNTVQGQTTEQAFVYDQPQLLI